MPLPLCLSLPNPRSAAALRESLVRFPPPSLEFPTTVAILALSSNGNLLWTRLWTLAHFSLPTYPTSPLTRRPQTSRNRTVVPSASPYLSQCLSGKRPPKSGLEWLRLSLYTLFGSHTSLSSCSHTPLRDEGLHWQKGVRHVSNRPVRR